MLLTFVKEAAASHPPGFRRNESRKCFRPCTWCTARARCDWPGLRSSNGQCRSTEAQNQNQTCLTKRRPESVLEHIIDIKLPGGPDGWEIARRARELRADLPVVYTTADSAADWPAKGVPNSVVVQKPYAGAQLLTAISTLMTEADTNRTS